MSEGIDLYRDRCDFMSGDDRVELDDGIVIEIHDDPDGWLSAAEHENPEECEYVGVVVTDPATGISDSLWGTGLAMRESGVFNRAYLWDTVVGHFYDLLGTVRAQRDTEVGEVAYWAARDVVTL